MTRTLLPLALAALLVWLLSGCMGATEAPSPAGTSRAGAPIFSTSTVGVAPFRPTPTPRSPRPLTPITATRDYPVLESYARWMPVIDGSTSTLPLRALILCRAYAVPCGWDDAYGEEWHRQVAAAGDSTAATMFRHVVENRAPSHGTHGAYDALVAAEADLILVARPPSADERDVARDAQVELEGVPVAYDAFVFFVNSENPVQSITLDQARQIYSGELTNWADLGGPDMPIFPFQRNENSGSQELMEAMVMGETPMVASPEMVLISMGEPLIEVAHQPAGIAYSVYYYVTQMVEQPNMRLLAIDGVMPSPESLADGSYPLRSEVLAVRRRSPSATVRELYEWLLSDEGQSLVAESGYVPIRPVR
ncbi:MAG: substrate-binding domain-containing protein [Ardenticatenales bacterium]|nr:substrate-binding domain-containing protein [Ardenticatenales bacterium]